MYGYLINSRYLIAEIRLGLIAHESSLGGADVSGLWATRDNLPLIVMIMIVMIMIVMIMMVMIMIVMIMMLQVAAADGNGADVFVLYATMCCL